jgi:hypothetical protein
MNKLQHTPGPWKAKRFSVIKSNGYKITQNRPVAAAPEAWVEIDRTYEANARLIAAAPEMLNELIKIYTTMYMTQRECYWMPIKDVIEKATGMSIDEILK